MENKYKDPIIITGVPRSGTSMVSGIFDLCGAFGGNTCGATPWNKRGQFENHDIIQEIQKPYLKRIGRCTLGQRDLPHQGDIIVDMSVREQTLEVMRRSGLQHNQIWYFKDCKAALTYQLWDACFPDATWVIVDRPSEQIVDSCMKQPFMSAYTSKVQWHDWVARYRLFLCDIERNVSNVVRLWSPEIAYGRFDDIKMAIEWCGLSWDEDKVAQFVDAKLFNIA